MVCLHVGGVFLPRRLSSIVFLASGCRRHEFDRKGRNNRGKILWTIRFIEPRKTR